MQATVQWNHHNGMLFVGSTGSGHVVTMDGAPEGGGDNRAPGPWSYYLPVPEAVPPMMSY